MNVRILLFLKAKVADSLIVSSSMVNMSDDHNTNPPMQPGFLSMEVDDDDSFESEY